MIAYIALPGSRHFDYSHSVDGRTREGREEIDFWINEAIQKLQDNHPAAWPQPYGTLSNKEAAKWRYRDGSAVIRHDNF